MAINSASSAKGVTSTATAGQAQTSKIVTTPVTGAAVAAPKSTLSLLRGIVDETVKNVRSLVSPLPSNAKLYPYNTPVSAAGAFRSPSQTVASNYRPVAAATGVK